MTRREYGFTGAIAIVVIATGMSACSGDRAVPTAPTAPPSQTGPPMPPDHGVTFTLSGVVSEVTPEGPLPLNGAEVEVGVCPRVNFAAESYMTAVTDARGFYSVQGMCAGITYVWVAKTGYKVDPPKQCDGDCLYATINGDTRFDIELIRRSPSSAFSLKSWFSILKPF